MKKTKCNKIFAIFLAQVAKILNLTGFREIAFFICIFRNTLNELGWKALAKVRPDLEADIK